MREGFSLGRDIKKRRPGQVMDNIVSLVKGDERRI
jgi:hypothetical protein